MSGRNVSLWDDDDFEDGAAAIEEAQQEMGNNLQASVDWRTRLMDDGNPQPSYILKNTQDKGYSCPRMAYVQSEETLNMQQLAIEWAINIQALYNWSKEQNWERQRRDYWAKESERMWEASGETLALLRGRTLQRVTRGFRTMQDLCLEMARSGQKGKLVNGQLVFMPYEPKDIAALEKAYGNAAKNELAALGLNLMVKESGDGLEEESSAPINMLVFNMPANEQEQTQLAALPMEVVKPALDGLETGETVEGELVANE
jgi:hypothetical protein